MEKVVIDLNNFGTNLNETDKVRSCNCADTEAILYYYFQDLRNPIHYVCESRSFISIAELLLDRGAAPDSVDAVRALHLPENSDDSC